MINKKPIEVFKFGEFLTDKILKQCKQVSFIDVKLVYEFSKLLEKEYAQILDYLNTNVIDGKIIKLESYIKSSINGSITTIIKDFIFQHNVKTTCND